MKKSTFAAALLFGALAFVGCSDDSSSGGTKGFRLEFDAPALAAKLNTDFESFRTSCEKYATTSSSGADLELKGYVWADQDSVLLRIAVTEDRYGNVGRIDALAEKHNTEAEISLWRYFLTNADALQLGSFLGTKHRETSGSGVFQTIDETIANIDNNGTDDIYSYTIFGVIPGNAYAVFSLEDGLFSASLMNNYLTLDYPVMRGWLGGDHAAFAQEHYIIGNKMNVFGNIYVYFDSARDLQGNQFTADVNADAEGSLIADIELYLSSSYDATQQLAIWKQYATGAETLGLGTFKEACTVDNFGEVTGTFASADEAVAHVEQNGRPGAFDDNVKVAFEADGVTTELLLKASEITVQLKK